MITYYILTTYLVSAFGVFLYLYLEGQDLPIGHRFYVSFFWIVFFLAFCCYQLWCIGQIRSSNLRFTKVYLKNDWIIIPTFSLGKQDTGPYISFNWLCWTFILSYSKIY